MVRYVFFGHVLRVYIFIKSIGSFFRVVWSCLMRIACTCHDWLHSPVGRGMYKNVHSLHTNSSPSIASLHDICRQIACAFSFFCTILHAAVLIDWLTTYCCHHCYFLRGGSTTPNMTSSETGSAVWNSNYFVELFSKSAGMSLRYSTRSQVQDFSRALVPVKIRIRVWRTGLVTTSTCILLPKPGAQVFSIPRRNLSSRILFLPQLSSSSTILMTTLSPVAQPD